jgi:hypothetical protein
MRGGGVESVAINVIELRRSTTTHLEEAYMQKRVNKVAGICLVLVAVFLITESKDSAAAYPYQYPSMPYTIFYTDATKTVDCGYFDACSGEGEGCQTEYYTRAFYACCL